MVGRNKFFHRSAAEPPASIGGGLEAWRGFYSSVRPAHKQLMVNVNVATTAFYSANNLANAMVLYRNATFGARIDNFLRGLRVMTTHLQHKKTVKKASNFTARSHKFSWEEVGEVVTVEYYFRKSKI